MISKAKWFAVRKPNIGEIIAISANQFVPSKFRGPTKMLYYIHQTPFPLAVLKGDLGTRLLSVLSLTTLVRHSGRVGGRVQVLNLGT